MTCRGRIKKTRIHKTCLAICLSVLVVSVARAEVTINQDYKAAREDALDCDRDGDDNLCKKARIALSTIIEGGSAECEQEVSGTGSEFSRGPWMPWFYRGLVNVRLDKCDEALKDFTKSESCGYVVREPKLKQQMTDKRQWCQTLTGVRKSGNDVLAQAEGLVPLVVDSNDRMSLNAASQPLRLAIRSTVAVDISEQTKTLNDLVSTIQERLIGEVRNRYIANMATLEKPIVRTLVPPELSADYNNITGEKDHVLNSTNHNDISSALGKIINLQSRLKQPVRARLKSLTADAAKTTPGNERLLSSQVGDFKASSQEASEALNQEDLNRMINAAAGLSEMLNKAKSALDSAMNSKRMEWEQALNVAKNVTDDPDQAETDAGKAIAQGITDGDKAKNENQVDKLTDAIRLIMNQLPLARAQVAGQKNDYQTRGNTLEEGVDAFLAAHKDDLKADTAKDLEDAKKNFSMLDGSSSLKDLREKYDLLLIKKSHANSEYDDRIASATQEKNRVEACVQNVLEDAGDSLPTLVKQTLRECPTRMATALSGGSAFGLEREIGDCKSTCDAEDTRNCEKIRNDCAFAKGLSGNLAVSEPLRKQLKKSLENIEPALGANNCIDLAQDTAARDELRNLRDFANRARIVVSLREAFKVLAERPEDPNAAIVKLTGQNEAVRPEDGKSTLFLWSLAYMHYLAGLSPTGEGEMEKARESFAQLDFTARSMFVQSGLFPAEFVSRMSRFAVNGQ